MNMIGKKSPEWSANAYVNGSEQTVSSREYEGVWHVIYWYPLDFTFVCPTEIRGFQALQDAFQDEGIAVIGASTDSFFSHRAWFSDRETFAEEITHPVLADTNHAVSRAFGVLKAEEGVAYRATAIIDDKGVVRALSINDLDVGRSPKEILRTVQAFQSGGLCGADWSKGDEFVG